VGHGWFFGWGPLGGEGSRQKIAEVRNYQKRATVVLKSGAIKPIQSNNNQQREERGFSQTSKQRRGTYTLPDFGPRSMLGLKMEKKNNVYRPPNFVTQQTSAGKKTKHKAKEKRTVCPTPILPGTPNGQTTRYQGGEKSMSKGEEYGYHRPNNQAKMITRTAHLFGKRWGNDGYWSFRNFSGGPQDETGTS